MMISNTKQPLVSVITPAYNAEKFIRETIESVINQTYENWEMLIVNDGSTDKTIKVANSYAEKDPRIKVYELGHNSGRPAVPRNYAIKNAQGKYLTFLDADDVWLKNKLEIQVSLMEKESHVDMSYGLIRKLKNYFLINTPFDKVQNERTLRYVNLIAISTVMIKKDALLRVGLFTLDPLHRGSEDWDLWQQLAMYNCKFYFIRRTLALYRRVENSVSSEKEHKMRLKLLAPYPVPIRYRFLQIFVYKPCKIADFVWFLIKKITGTRMKY